MTSRARRTWEVDWSNSKRDRNGPATTGVVCWSPTKRSRAAAATTAAIARTMCDSLTVDRLCISAARGVAAAEAAEVMASNASSVVAVAASEAGRVEDRSVLIGLTT